MVNNTITLNASLRTQLLSLQKTQGLTDKIQLRLATGKAVNTAIDNPDNFFASRSLLNRAGDLGRLLDGIGQNIQVIQSAANTVEGLGSLVKQAEAVTQQAQDLLPLLQTEARTTGDRNLKDINDLTSLNGINNGDRLRLTFRDRTDEIISPIPVFVSLNTNMSGAELVNAINNINDNLTEETINASLNIKGQLEIKTINGDILMIEFVSGAFGTGTAATNIALAEALGFQDQVQFSNDLLNQNSVGFVISPDPVLTSFLFEDVTTGETALRSSLISNLRTSGGLNPTFGFLGAGDQYEIGINSGTRQNIALDNTTSVQGFIDAINSNDSLNKFLKADFIEETGQITIEAIDGGVESIELGVSTNPAGFLVVAYFGFDTRAPVAFAPAFNPDISSIRLPKAQGEIRALESEYRNILVQIDQITQDSSYRGVNLVNGDDMTTSFNESRKSQLVTEGVTFTASGLELGRADFSNNETIETTLTDVRNALETIRSFGFTLANDLNIITSRETLAKSIINTLTSGADKLTLADQNAEGARLLALQTRQQIQVSILSVTGNQTSIANFLQP